MLAFIPDQSQAGADGKSAADGEGCCQRVVLLAACGTYSRQLPASAQQANPKLKCAERILACWLRPSRCPAHLCMRPAGDPDVWQRQLEAGVLAAMRLTARLALSMAQRGRWACGGWSNALLSLPTL